MSYALAALDIALGMLTASGTFQDLVGADDATEALAFAVKTHGGTPAQRDGSLDAAIAADGSSIDLTTPPYAIVGISDPPKATLGGVGVWDRTGSIGVRLVLQRTLDDETPAESTDRAWDVAGDIVAELEAMIGAAGGFADADLDTSALYLDDDGVHRDHQIIELTITYRG
jgi:hypothetical protein